MIDISTEEAIKVCVHSMLPNTRDVDEIEFLPGGWSNRNYRMRVDGKDVVLRLKSRIPEKPEIERDFLACELAPALLAYDTTTGNMVTEWVEGELACNVPLEPVACATYLNELHTYIPRQVNYYDVYETIDTYFEDADVDSDILRIYHSKKWVPRNIQGCHNELNAWNVIVKEDGFCTLDWESAGDNDPIFDLVGFCYGMRYSDEQVNACNNAYQLPTDNEHLHLTRVIYQIREHAWAVDRIKRGSQMPEIHEQLITSKAEILRLCQGVDQPGREF